MQRKKQNLGQFFTSNVNFILAGFENLCNNKSVLDPFAGKGDLLHWAIQNGACSIKGLDIDKNLIDNKIIYYNDSLDSIPTADFNLTNPPYLAKNKMNKYQKSKLDFEDLYMLSVKNIIKSSCPEGIIIVPINFISAENSISIRKEFLSLYKINKAKLFKFQVFDDTTYNVIAFHYTKSPSSIQTFPVEIYSNINDLPHTIDLTLERKFNYCVAGQKLSNILNTNYNMKRLTDDMIRLNSGKNIIKLLYNDTHTEQYYSVNDKLLDTLKNNIILFNCIDKNPSKNGWIKAQDIRDYGVGALVGKQSSRNLAYVLTNYNISKQKQAIGLFNSTLNNLRDKYQSLFLTNFRDNGRKRVSFEFCYKLMTHCLNKI